MIDEPTTTQMEIRSEHQGAVRDKRRGYAGVLSGNTFRRDCLCPTLYRFIFADSYGQISITDSFGTCSDLPELRVAPKSVMAVFPNMNGAGTTSYRLQGEEVG